MPRRGAGPWAIARATTLDAVLCGHAARGGGSALSTERAADCAGAEPAGAVDVVLIGGATALALDAILTAAALPAARRLQDAATIGAALGVCGAAADAARASTVRALALAMGVLDALFAEIVCRIAVRCRGVALGRRRAASSETRGNAQATAAADRGSAIGLGWAVAALSVDADQRRLANVAALGLRCAPTDAIGAALALQSARTRQSARAAARGTVGCRRLLAGSRGIALEPCRVAVSEAADRVRGACAAQPLLAIAAATVSGLAAGLCFGQEQRSTPKQRALPSPQGSRFAWSVHTPAMQT